MAASILPATVSTSPDQRIGFLGPPGTFGEEALLTQPDYARGDLRPMASHAEIITAVEAGELDVGFLGFENSIEGSVRSVLDHLIFETDLLIQREVVLPISQNLVAPPGTTLADVTRVVSFPDAMEQCREWFARELPGVELVAANSTAEAVQSVAAERPAATAALGTSLAARLYGLEVLAPGIEDFPDNSTRFVAVARDGIPAPTGHDKTSIVLFQAADRPGNLHLISAQFAAREINLTKFESRPTKKSLGDYCFIIDCTGHVADEVLADCLRNLRADVGEVKFLGSYPAAGEGGEAIRREAEAKWKAADEWVAGLRAQVRREG
jgi:prephenate dehydratase